MQAMHILCFRLVCPLCYYALSFGVRELPGNVYINNVISSLVEGIAYAGCFTIAWWGRKWPTVASFVGAALALMISALLTEFSPGRKIIQPTHIILVYIMWVGWHIYISQLTYYTVIHFIFWIRITRILKISKLEIICWNYVHQFSYK